MSMALLFYDVVVATHVVAVIASFGVLFLWPVLPSGTEAAHTARVRLIAAMSWISLLVVAAGAYLASDRDLWGEIWVLVPLGLYVVILGLVSGVIGPGERRLARALARPGAAADARELRQLNALALSAAALVAVAAFFMVAKPFA